MNTRYSTASEMSKKWGLSERSVRAYCQQGRVTGAYINGKTWMIPSDAGKPGRKKKSSKRDDLVGRLSQEMGANVRGGVYHHLQVSMSYNSNHMEGTRLTEDQTRFIFETGTVTPGDGGVRVDDVVETTNHFRCFDYVIRTHDRKLTKTYLKNIHRLLKQGTSDATVRGYAIGEFKKLPNTVGDMDTVQPEDVDGAVSELLERYESISVPKLEDVLGFHVRFEEIHPFQDGNGRVGRLIMFKECLRSGMVPFVIEDEFKSCYINGIRQWRTDSAYLLDTCRSAQDDMLEIMKKYRIDSVNGR